MVSGELWHLDHGPASVYRWFDDRLGRNAIQDDISSKYVPPHANIFCRMGGLVFTAFIIQAPRDGLCDPCIDGLRVSW
jgi:quinol-cytochrome oxidoreductase complex cytochrome b subunit